MKPSKMSLVTRAAVGCVAAAGYRETTACEASEVEWPGAGQGA